MNFEQIKELGRKTNRIIEIDQHLKTLQIEAKKALDKDNYLISVSLIENALDVSRAEKKHKDMERFLTGILPGVASIKSFAVGSKDCIDIKFQGKSQMIIIDAMIRALEIEQKELTQAITLQQNSSTIIQS